MNIEKLGFKQSFFKNGKVKLNYVKGPNNGDAIVLIPGQIVISNQV